jgi:hypothetical protein
VVNGQAARAASRIVTDGMLDCGKDRYLPGAPASRRGARPRVTSYADLPWERRDTPPGQLRSLRKPPLRRVRRGGARRSAARPRRRPSGATSRCTRPVGGLSRPSRAIPETSARRRRANGPHPLPS